MKTVKGNAKRPKKVKLLEGLAECIDCDGVGRLVKKGEVVYIREIPNMKGHCIILKNAKTPLVGYHIDRFRLLKDSEV